MLKNICLFIFCFCIVGCKKTKEDPPLVRLIPQEVKDYCYFLPGTYWIYEDSISGAQDSVWVWDAYGSIDTLAKDNPFYLDPGIYEWFQIKTSSSYFNVDYFYWCNTSRTMIRDNVCYQNIVREIIGNSLVAESICATIPFTKGNFAFSSNDKIISVNYFGSKNGYGDVMEFHNDHNSSEYNSETTFYHAKHFGIIEKYIYATNQHWKLKYFKILQ